MIGMFSFDIFSVGLLQFYFHINDGLFTLPDSDTVSNSDSKPNGYIVLCRTFHTAQSQIQISIQLPTTGGSVNVNMPLIFHQFNDELFSDFSQYSSIICTH